MLLLRPLEVTSTFRPVYLSVKLSSLEGYRVPLQACCRGVAQGLSQREVIPAQVWAISGDQSTHWDSETLSLRASDYSESFSEYQILRISHTLRLWENVRASEGLRLSDSQAFRHSDPQTFRLSDSQTPRPQTLRFSDPQTVRFSEFQILRFSEFQILTISEFSDSQNLVQTWSKLGLNLVQTWSRLGPNLVQTWSKLGLNLVQT